MCWFHNLPNLRQETHNYFLFIFSLKTQHEKSCLLLTEKVWLFWSEKMTAKTSWERLKKSYNWALTLWLKRKPLLSSLSAMYPCGVLRLLTSVLMLEEILRFVIIKWSEKSIDVSWHRCVYQLSRSLSNHCNCSRSLHCILKSQWENFFTSYRPSSLVIVLLR